MTEATIPLRVTYDPEANAGYIYLAEEPPSGWRHCKTVPLDPIEVGGMINLDLDGDGRLMGLEVLDARSVLSDQLLTGLTGR
jgi:uncharacterized protein YuzE